MSRIRRAIALITVAIAVLGPATAAAAAAFGHPVRGLSRAVPVQVKVMATVPVGGQPAGVGQGPAGRAFCLLVVARGHKTSIAS